ncbi:hypothetical protein ORI20_31495 [Mycobacterium sp. CVI_P3]|uniref:Uncharacterized protein n=1 Tax=Mycobacterium pinniadriaticum TaxID=2994102 RepID=A0ABT3SNU3_9MYCO|nr:hypothetical protein [Mycobacterium pinniadriaticum]MCX2934793.1 hypothetical protein [Mycobacterium pinniadriaticum]MCX2941208.1 hypothetical protein [Mycobacterium pinniadriaticum]
MPWYDWVLWAGMAYMFVGTDFSLNWLGGVAFGRRVHRRSRNPFETIYWYVWARDDPSVRGEKVVGDPSILPPWITNLCIINAVFTCMVELFLLIGMLQTPRPSWIFVPALLFPARAVIEMIYGSQIIWGPARIRGSALANYLVIGLVPQVLLPCLVAWRFSGLGLGWIPGLLFVGTPVLIMLWTWAVYRRNPIPALADEAGAG